MSLLESLASLLFPPRCAFCGKPGVHGVCSECEKALPYCKTPLHERAEIGACLAPLKYEGIVREALLSYKFHASQSRCTGFGDVLAQAAAEHFGGEFDLVTYVPVSKKRKQERGYDQSYLLARETCRHWSVAPETLLQKTKDNVAQSSLSSREERQKNVVGAYVARQCGQNQGSAHSAHRRYPHHRRHAPRSRESFTGSWRGKSHLRHPRRGGRRLKSSKKRRREVLFFLIFP